MTPTPIDSPAVPDPIESRNKEVASAIALRINFLNSRAKAYRQQAIELFQANEPARAYRALGQADEISVVLEELQQLRFQIQTGEALATLN